MSTPEKEAHAPQGPPVSSEAVGTLRKLKETETLWQKKLEDARSRGETKIKYAQAARDRAVADARRVADEFRTQRLQSARTGAEVEARKILEEARTEAARLGSLTGAQIDDRMEEVLGAVLGVLRTPPSRAAGKAQASVKAAAPMPAR